MGKYDKWIPKMLKDNFNEDEFKFNALFAIANELAEANRLKRLELQHIFADMRGFHGKPLEDALNQLRDQV